MSHRLNYSLVNSSTHLQLESIFTTLANMYKHLNAGVLKPFRQRAGLNSFVTDSEPPESTMCLEVLVHPPIYTLLDFHYIMLLQNIDTQLHIGKVITLLTWNCRNLSSMYCQTLIPDPRIYFRLRLVAFIMKITNIPQHRPMIYLQPNILETLQFSTCLL